jgi:uncharacterized protein
MEYINDIELLVKNYMEKYDTSHNYNHVIRVKNTAIKIANSENLNEKDTFEVILGALFHDVGDSKYTNDIKEQEKIIREFLNNKIEPDVIDNIVYISGNISLSKEISHQNTNIYTKDFIDKNKIKLYCVQDADRIDSLGSIGIARYFIYGVIKKNNNIEDTILELQNRTDILLKYIKTSLGKQLANEKYKIIKLFIDDFNNTT